ncbi:hypothetical protein MRX96_002628 [Rhipicephalus microplus]
MAQFLVNVKMSANQPKGARLLNFTKEELAVLVGGYEVNRWVIESLGESPRWSQATRPDRGPGATSRQPYSLSRGSFESSPMFERNDATSRASPRHEREAEFNEAQRSPSSTKPPQCSNTEKSTHLAPCVESLDTEWTCAPRLCRRPSSVRFAPKVDWMRRNHTSAIQALCFVASQTLPALVTVNAHIANDPPQAFGSTGRPSPLPQGGNVLSPQEHQKSSHVAGNDTHAGSPRPQSKKRVTFRSTSWSRSRGPKSAQEHTESDKNFTAPSPAVKSTGPQLCVPPERLVSKKVEPVDSLQSQSGARFQREEEKWAAGDATLQEGDVGHSAEDDASWYLRSRI